jgi:predicted ArsR family transcriptional regulator
MDVPTWPGDALAQPSRHRLFEVLAELQRPAGTEELAKRVDLHPNGVRVHLERLLDAGLVIRERSRQPRGRPRDMWTIADDARPAGETPKAYADLGRWLARSIPSGKATLRAVEATGREVGRSVAVESGVGSAEQRMRDSLASMGFQPKREVDAAGVLTYRLCNCPYADAVRENPQAVCALHRGITRGLLDALAPETELTRFTPHDPITAGCVIELTGGLALDASASPPAAAKAPARP